MNDNLSLTEILKTFENEPDPSTGQPRKLKIIAALHDLATAPGNRNKIPAITEILNRLDGKVIDRHQVSTTIVTVGDEYAKLILDANRQELQQLCYPASATLPNPAPSTNNDSTEQALPSEGGK